MYQINAIGSTIAKSSNFTTNSMIYGIGVSGGNSPYGFFYMPEPLALSWNKVICKRQHHLLGRAYLPTVSMSCLSIAGC